MYKKYNITLILFLLLEKVPILYWTSKTLTPNHNVIYLSKKWFYLFTQITKNELILNNNFLIENSALDTSSYKTLPLKIKESYFNKILLFYTFYYYNIKTKLTVFVGNNLLKEVGYNSIDRIYNNANWLERETSEMYNVLFFWTLNFGT